jgi:Ca-activated chloride channel family protein
MFLLLWVVVGVGIFFVWRVSLQRRVLQRFSQEQLLKIVAQSFDYSRFILKKVLLTLVLFFSVVALARPQWGFEWREVKKEGLDILIVMDTSRSMLTQDVKPNRLERTKLAVQDLLKKLKGDRVGLIAFAGDAFMVCPLTVDYGGFLLSLNDVGIHTVPRGGTNIPAAIAEAIRGYDKTPNKYKAVIIITDGDNLEGDPLFWAKKAHEKGIRIYCVGIGTKEGDLIQVVDDAGGGSFVKDPDGNFVKSRLNEELLQQVALGTGGVYVRASGAEFGLDLIYDQELARLEKREIEGRKEKRYYDQYPFPLAVAFLLLVIETCMTTRKKK